MKRSIAVMLSALGVQAVILGCCPVFAEEDKASSVITDTAEETEEEAAEDSAADAETSGDCVLEDGVYSAEFDTDSSMFHVNEAN